MRFIGGIVCGVVAGVVGAVNWARIPYCAQVQPGIIAVGIGGRVGMGVGNGGAGGMNLPR